jgi:hypothetical protein
MGVLIVAVTILGCTKNVTLQQGGLDNPSHYIFVEVKVM